MFASFFIKNSTISSLFVRVARINGVQPNCKTEKQFIEITYF